MMDLTTAKTATLRNGEKVINIHYVKKNSAGQDVTFPIKGSIKRVHKRLEYKIWKLNGRAEVFGESPYDIVKINN